MLNILSIDLEDYFMVSAFEDVVKREDWTKYESRIERNTHRLLEILENCHPPHKNESSQIHHSELSIQHSEERIHNSALSTQHCQKATFFCLGWVAKHYPRLITEIHARGHEIACHSYDHRVITAISPEKFREDVRRSKEILEDLTGDTVLGYRAPSFSITDDTLWALEILAEEGFLYDSSIFPIHHDRYGIPNAPRHPFLIDFNDSDIPSQLKNPRYLTPVTSTLNATRSTSPTPSIVNPIRSTSPVPSTNPSPCSFHLMPQDFLFEFPLSTFKFFGQNIPISGGGYFRAFPLGFTRWVLRRIQSEDSTPFIVYIHPWEIDPDQPKVGGISYKSRFRHYINIDKTEGRLISLLQETAFSSFRDFLNEVIGVHHTRSS